MHVFQLLAHLGQTNLEFVQGVVQRLNLARQLIQAAGRIALLFLQVRLQRRLQGVEGRGRLVDGVGVLFHQVFHHAHALVKAALHRGHLLLQLLDLRLQLDHVLVDAPRRRGRQPEHRNHCEHCQNTVSFHRRFP